MAGCSSAAPSRAVAKPPPPFSPPLLPRQPYVCVKAPPALLPKAPCLETSLQDPGSQLIDSPSYTRSRDPLLLTHFQDRNPLPHRPVFSYQTLSVITEPSLVLICNHLLVIFLHWGWGYLECVCSVPSHQNALSCEHFYPSSLLHHSSMGCMIFAVNPVCLVFIT